MKIITDFQERVIECISDEYKSVEDIAQELHTSKTVVRKAINVLWDYAIVRGSNFRMNSNNEPFYKFIKS